MVRLQGRNTPVSRRVEQGQKGKILQTLDTFGILTIFDYQVLEYTLFQPGTFTNYFTAPFKSSDNVQQVELPWDFYRRRAILLEGSENDRISLTTSQDLANMVARAIEFAGDWPVVGGIRGSELSVKEIIALGEKVRGKSLTGKG